MKVLKPFLACLCVGAFLLLLTGEARAVTLLDPVEGKKEALELVGKLLALQPDGNATNTGVLKIRVPKQKTIEIPVEFGVLVTTTNWQNFYRAKWTNKTEELAIIHAADGSAAYFYGSNLTHQVPILGDIPILGHLFRSHQVSGDQLTAPFAGSDFSIGDLGLDFLHWPAQRVVKKEFTHECGCSVLESLNPDPNSKGYSKVLTWFDNDSLGVVQAQAYDAKGDEVKEFHPKSLSKVNGQWQVDEIEMDNIQTGSRTVITFDVGK